MKIKKNCYNCAELDYEDEVDSDGYIIGGGFSCDKQYNKEEERGTPDTSLDRLQMESYRQKSKVCFIGKEANED